jgi:hypothetical protein
MATVSVYCFVAAGDKEEAARIVGVEIEERCEREFYEDWEVLEDGVRPLSALSDDYLTEEYSHSQDMIQRFREEGEQARKKGNRLAEACAARRLSDLLCENMCPDMPWFNFEGYDFSLPSGPPGIGQWFAVMVEFYY